MVKGSKQLMTTTLNTCINEKKDPDNAVMEWWIDKTGEPIEEVALEASMMASLPVESHTYSAQEMWPCSATNRTPLSDLPTSFKEIIQAAMVLSRFLNQTQWLGEKKTELDSHTRQAIHQTGIGQSLLPR
jgi:hypothetical protein